MGNTDNVIVLFDRLHVPRYVKYGALIVRCSLYRKHIDICYECGRLGHRADVCPNADEKYAEAAAWRIRRKNTSVKQDVSYADKVTSRETDAARQNTRYRIWSGEDAGSDEEEKKRRPKHHTASTTTINELARQRARTPRDQKASEQKAHPRDHTRGTAQVEDPVQNTFENPFENPIKIHGNVKIAIQPRRGTTPGTEQEITQIRQLLEQITRENATLREEVKMVKVENAKLKNQKHSEMTHTTPTPIRASTPLRASATPVPASMSAETPPHNRRAKENADEQTDSTLGEVKGMFQEMSVGLQQQFMQMRADLQQITQMRVEMSQRFDALEGRVAQLENVSKDARPAGARPVKSKPYSRPAAAENSCIENSSSQHGAA
ncbi:hypothetical protein HPB52_001911 [Rhipicephalus sanguineus]|uniref:CCHC-type domain-containing protein n=1 Tax=Rhipicephalus sanguineus TaxID=34632 RepID=A0A9D4PH21_RHISA|nr:hypothetical protein HPB52_001911 [Rhipicephalus sanguineus]